MKIEIKNIIATFQRVIRACNGTTAQNVPQQMLYIVGICGSMAYEVNKQYEKALVSIIYFSIFVAIAFFTKSDLVCNMHMKKENLEKYIL